MNVNTTYLRIAQNDHNDHWNVSVQNDKGSKHSVYLTNEEFLFALRCMTNTAEFYPFFGDISYHIRFTWDAIRIVDLSNREYSDTYYVFPMSLVAEFFSRDNNKVYEATNDDCLQVKNDFAPVPYWEYHNWDNESVEKSIVQWAEYGGLKNCIERLHNIAANYSNGIMGNACIHIQLDTRPRAGLPDSYYFYILDSDNHRVMNGGIIYHPDHTDDNQFNRDENGVVTGSYSIHT